MREISGIRIHFIGANGSSICGLMRIAAYLGAKVSGSDSCGGENILTLLRDGFDVYVGERPDIAATAELTVYSGAVPPDNIERLAASGKTMERGDFLGLLSQCFEKTVAVAGTHGKTTVTSILAHVLSKTHKSFCSHAGDQIIQGSSVILNGRKLFVTEACEYRQSFLSLHPAISVICNIEYDHPDCYPNPEAMLEAYEKFAANTTECLIMGKNVSNVLMCAPAHVRTLAQGKDFDIVCGNAHIGSFVYKKNLVKTAFAVPTRGEYNLTNLAIALAVLDELCISAVDSADALASFAGVHRRRQYLGKYKGAEIYTDYAHHPTQIKALLESFRNTGKKIITVFEPHTYSRTKTLAHDFAEALALSDVLLLLPVFGAREKYDPSGESKVIFDKTKISVKCLCNNYRDVTEYLKTSDISNSYVLFVGAGSINSLAEKTVERH